MTAPKRPRPQPDRTPQAEADRVARLEREATALRANLRRRKEQVRAREAAEHCPTAAPAPGSTNEQ